MSTSSRTHSAPQQRQALADIDAKIREAEMQGNTTLLAALEEQRRKLEELYALKERNLEKDIQARKEQERAAKSKSDTSSSSGGSGGSSGSSGSSSSSGSSGSSSGGGGAPNKSSGFSLTINTTGGIIDRTFAEELARKIKPALDDISRRST
jgi:activator of HSP90 ATPase